MCIYNWKVYNMKVGGNPSYGVAYSSLYFGKEVSRHLIHFSRIGRSPNQIPNNICPNNGPGGDGKLQRKHDNLIIWKGNKTLLKHFIWTNLFCMKKKGNTSASVRSSSRQGKSSNKN